MPQYIEPLKQEVQEKIKEHGWTKTAMDAMWKTDSFCKESLRLNGVNHRTSPSLADRDLHFLIPVTNSVAVPQVHEGRGTLKWYSHPSGHNRCRHLHWDAPAGGAVQGRCGVQTIPLLGRAREGWCRRTEAAVPYPDGGVHRFWAWKARLVGCGMHPVRTSSGLIFPFDAVRAAGSPQLK